MQQTSLLSYRRLERIGAKQLRCYELIEKGAVCNWDIADRLHLPINSITPRVNELREMGLVEEAYKDINPATDRKSIYWRVT